MADQKALVSLKDGTKIEITDLAELSKYSERQDLDSISFFSPDEIIDAGVADAGVQLVAAVQQPKADPVVVKPQPAQDNAAAITAMIGALAGALSSAGTPALTNLVKSLLKDKLKFKKKGGDQKSEEEAEEPTDCKTHQLKASAKFASVNARLSALENKSSSGGSPLTEIDVEDVEERLQKLEKQFKKILTGDKRKKT